MWTRTVLRSGIPSPDRSTRGQGRLAVAWIAFGCAVVWAQNASPKPRGPALRNPPVIASPEIRANPSTKWLYVEATSEITPATLQRLANLTEPLEVTIPAGESM